MSKGFEGTKGPWVVHQRPNSPFEYGHHVTTPDGLTVCSVSYQAPVNTPAGIRESARIANAELIAEAGTVLHETGLTPRQLGEQRAELLEALQRIAESGYDSTTGEGHADCCQIARFALAGRDNATQQRNATGGEG